MDKRKTGNQNASKHEVRIDNLNTMSSKTNVDLWDTLKNPLIPSEGHPEFDDFAEQGSGSNIWK